MEKRRRDGTQKVTQVTAISLVGADLGVKLDRQPRLIQDGAPTVVADSSQRRERRRHQQAHRRPQNQKCSRITRARLAAGTAITSGVLYLEGNSPTNTNTTTCETWKTNMNQCRHPPSSNDAESTPLRDITRQSLHPDHTQAILYRGSLGRR